MVGHRAVIRFVPVVFLNEVVPGAPLPNHYPGGTARGLDLHETIGHEVVRFDDRVGAPTGRERLVERDSFTNNQEHVAVGQFENVVVLYLPVLGETGSPKRAPRSR